MNTVDPLNIHIGNSGLKSSITNELVTSWKFNTRYHDFNNKILFMYDRTSNDLVKGYTYDGTTGIRTIRTYNVDGRHHYGIQEYFSLSFGKKNRFSLQNSTSVDWINAVDMIGENGLYPTKQAVRNRLISQSLKLNYTINGQTISMLANGLFRNSRGDYANFENFDSKDYTLGLTGTFKLPFGFGISTDLTLYKRDGYSAKEMNKTNLVWNGRLTYSTMKGKWVFMLDGFDILHQLNNVSYIVNAQGKTETYSNVLPRYVLFHIKFNLNVQPSNKRK